MQSNSTVANELSVQEAGDQYLTFVLCEEEYAIDILKVQEIKSHGPVTPIPCAPEYMLGVINLRGAIVPVIDLRQRFGLEAKPSTPTTAVIIVRVAGEAGERIAGLVVDEVAEVYHLEEAQIQSSVDIAGTIDRDYIRGLAQAEDKLVIMINLDQIVQSSLELMELDASQIND